MNNNSDLLNENKSRKQIKKQKGKTGKMILKLKKKFCVYEVFENFILENVNIEIKKNTVSEFESLNGEFFLKEQ